MGVVYTGAQLRDPVHMALIDNEDAAKRTARAIASDIWFYYEKKIDEGIEKDNLFDLVSEQIEEGRALFKRRLTPELHGKNFYLFERALVDILLKTKGHIASKLW